MLLTLKLQVNLLRQEENKSEWNGGVEGVSDNEARAKTQP